MKKYKNISLIWLLLVLAFFIGMGAMWFYTIKRGERYTSGEHRDEAVPYH